MKLAGKTLLAILARQLFCRRSLIAPVQACSLSLIRYADIVQLDHRANQRLILIVLNSAEVRVTRSSEKLLFSGLIAVQALHSVEEFVFRLYDVFPPARFLSGLIGSDRQFGFVVINVFLVLFGMWCYVWPVRREWPAAGPLMWGWVVVELSNGIVHPAWSVAQRSYTPGVVTSILLLPMAFLLGWKLSRRTRGAA